MRRKLIIGLVLLNGLIAAAMFALPAETQILPRGVFNCCKVDTGGDDFCCRSCCWLTWNCNDHDDCRMPPRN